MKLLSALWAFALRKPNSAVSAQDADSNLRQVAIIGAGAAGSSTAYYLRKFAEQDGVGVNITIFEKTDHIGGRTLTVNPYGDPEQRVELGASIFIKLNHILWNATSDFNLTLEEPYPDNDGILVVWDGEKIVYQQDNTSWGWWNLVKLFWKYGMAPYRTQKLMKAIIAKFLRLYDAPFFPFRSLSTRAYELELTYVTGQTGEQFLGQNNIGPQFAHDIIQASTRVNYASNLAHIHGLDTMVAMAPEGASQVAGGNWQIFDNMVATSGSNVQLNTSVASISLIADDQNTSKYTLKTTATASESAAGKEKEETGQFDTVVIATPYQFSDIEAGDDVLEHTIDKIPYVKLHVTLFASPYVVSPGFLNLPAGSRAVTMILTTLADDDDASSGPQGAGKAGFYSISTLRKITNPETGLSEYLYKIFSPEKVTPKFLSELLGVDVPETFTGIPPSNDPQAVEPISWYYPHVFNSYPKAYPRVTFQDPILREGLYYTSGMESFISTMETSALMGMNVARLIVDDILGLKTGEAAQTGNTTVQATGGEKIDEL